MLKYEDRLPQRKIKDTLKRIYGLNISPATILDLTRRAADAVQSQYDSILDRIRDVSILYVGETSIDVQGKKHWIRAIREHVVQRKIIGILRNEKGTSIHERLTTVLATWSQQGHDSLQMLRLKLE